MVPVPNLSPFTAQHRGRSTIHASTSPFEYKGFAHQPLHVFFTSQISFKQQSASPVNLSNRPGPRFQVPGPRSAPATGCAFPPPPRLKLFHRTEGVMGSIGMPVVNEWRHYTIMYNGGAVHTYRDGTGFGSYLLSSRSGKAYGVGNGEFQIGRTDAGWSSVPGFGGGGRVGDIVRFPKHIKGKQWLVQLGVGSPAPLTRPQPNGTSQCQLFENSLQLEPHHHHHHHFGVRLCHNSICFLRACVCRHNSTKCPCVFAEHHPFADMAMAVDYASLRMDELAFWNKRLTDQEVVTAMNHVT